MVEKVICFICCLFCAFPFLIIGYYDKGSTEPIGFWSGDTSLKKKVKDIKNYNKEMANLYLYCALAFMITGIIAFIHVISAYICIALESTLGIYLVWKKYKSILKKYS